MLKHAVLMLTVVGKPVQTYRPAVEPLAIMVHVQVVGRSADLHSHALWDITVYLVTVLLKEEEAGEVDLLALAG